MLHPKPQDLMPGRPGATQSMSYTGLQESTDCATQSNWNLLHPSPQNSPVEVTQKNPVHDPLWATGQHRLFNTKQPSEPLTLGHREAQTV